MKYPRWLPYPGCWVRSLVTSIALYLLSFLFIPLQPIIREIARASARIWILCFTLVNGSDPAPIDGLLVVGALLLTLFLFFMTVLCPAAVMGYLRQLLKFCGLRLEKKPAEFNQKLSRRSWIEGYGDLFNSGIGTMVGFIWIALASPTYGNQISPSEETFAVAFVLYFITQTYLYYARTLLQEASDRHKAKRQAKRQAAEQRKQAQRQERARRQATQQKKLAKRRKRDKQRRKPKLMHPFPEEFMAATKPPPPPGSIDEELEKMRRDLGL